MMVEFLANKKIEIPLAKMAQFSWFISMIIDRDFFRIRVICIISVGELHVLFFSYSIFYTFLESAVRATIESVVVPM